MECFIILYEARNIDKKIINHIIFHNILDKNNVDHCCEYFHKMNKNLSKSTKKMFAGEASW